MNHFYKLLLLFCSVAVLINISIYNIFSELNLTSFVLIFVLNILYGSHFINILSSHTKNIFKQSRRLVLFF